MIEVRDSITSLWREIWLSLASWHVIDVALNLISWQEIIISICVIALSVITQIAFYSLALYEVYFGYLEFTRDHSLVAFLLWGAVFWALTSSITTKMAAKGSVRPSKDSE